ncbi:MAG: hypothetical protein HRU33_10810 [Rhodobacteraceae bacterium]|nr:hypothetical protein [Paracoccaceae bacterium]
MKKVKKIEQDIGLKLLDVIPKLKNQIHLAGFLALLALFMFAYSISPDNLLAQVIAGLMGGVIIVFPLIFNFIHHFPDEDRAKFVTRVFFGFIFSIIFLATVTTIIILQEGNVDNARLEERAIVDLKRLEASLSSEISQKGILSSSAYSIGNTTQWKALNSEINTLRSQKDEIDKLLENRESYRKSLADFYGAYDDIVASLDMNDFLSLRGKRDLNLSEISENAQRLAEVELDSAIQLFHLAGRAAELSGEFSVAVEQFEKASTLDPKDAEHIFALGKAYEKVGDFKRARDSFTELVETNLLIVQLEDLEKIEAFLSLAISAWYLDDIGTAELAFDRAFEVVESGGHLKRKDAALIPLFSSKGGFHSFRGEDALARSNFLDAKDLYYANSAVSTAPIGSVELFANSSIHSYFLAEFDTAYEDAALAWQIAAESWDDTAYTKGVLASILAASQIELELLGEARLNLVTARSILQELGDRHPRNISLLFTEGRLELKSGNCTAALSKFEGALELADSVFKPDGVHSEQVGSLEGIVYASICLKQYSRTRKWFERARIAYADQDLHVLGVAKEVQFMGGLALLALVHGDLELHAQSVKRMQKLYMSGFRPRYFHDEWKAYHDSLA